MRDFFEVINDYPWTTFFVWLMAASMLAVFTDLINKFKK